jgi:hypothetical protein
MLRLHKCGGGRGLDIGSGFTRQRPWFNALSGRVEVCDGPRATEAVSPASQMLDASIGLRTKWAQWINCIEHFVEKLVVA